MNTIKSLTILSITFCCILTSCNGKNMKGENYFLLLKDNETISLNTYDNNKIKEQKTFTISEKSIYATDQKERVAILDTAKNAITLYDIQTSKETKLTIPYDINPRSILLNDENLFIGGEMGRKSLVQYYTQNRKMIDDYMGWYMAKISGILLLQYQIKNEKWYQLEIPKEVFMKGKEIDDLVMTDSLLIAIDNEIWPKYIILYQLNATEKLPYLYFSELKHNYPNEYIYQGRVTSNYFGLRSDAEFMRGYSQHITIYNSLDLTKSFTISSIKMKDRNEDKGNYHTYNDFLIIGNKVIIASKEGGFGFFEINDSYFKSSEDIWEKDFSHQISDSTVSYRAYPNENIIRLTQIPNSTKIVLTIENNNKNIRYAIIDI